MCYIGGEVLLNHLMFADDIYVFCPSVRGLQSSLYNRCISSSYRSHGIIFNCSETVCMTFKTKSAKSTVIPLLTLGGQSVKSVNCKYLGVVLGTELSDDKDIERQLRYQYCAANKLRVSFSRCSNVVKNELFPSVRPCTHHDYGVITWRHACRHCVWPIILGAGFYTRASQTFLFCDPFEKSFFYATR